MSTNFAGVGDKDMTGDNITLIDPNVPSGTTTLLLGGSMTAKTSLIVQSTKNLLRMYPGRFDAIVLMTESINSDPLQDLPSEVIRLPCYVPEILQLMIKINNATNNRYGFLVILDDCLQLRGKDITKAINIWRNSGLSTIISVQSPMFVNPSMRASFHNVFITGARTSEAQRKIGELFVYKYLEDKGIPAKGKQDDWIRKNTKLESNSRMLIRINGVTDEIFTHKIMKPK